MLKIKYISSNANFCLKLCMDIALIVSLFISLSGLINGLTVNFQTLVLSTTGGESIYFIANEENKELVNSEIPKDIIQGMDLSLVSYFSPIYVDSSSINDNKVDRYFLNITELLLEKPSFKVQGDIPTDEHEIMIGKGLWNQLFPLLSPQKELPLQVIIQNGERVENKNITAIFDDFSPWNFGILDDLNRISSEISFYSGFEFKIKNQLIFEVFEDNTNKFVNKYNEKLKIEFINLKKSNSLVKSIYQDAYSLFLFISGFIFLLFTLKVLHSSWMLFTRLKDNMTISKIIGMDNNQIQLEFWSVIFILGNIGLLFGMIIGIVFPQAISLLLGLLTDNIQTNFTPNISDVVLSIMVTNLIFFLSSFWVKKINITHKNVNYREF